MKCRFCGASNGEYEHRCVKCGRKLDPAVAPVGYSRSSPVMVALRHEACPQPSPREHSQPANSMPRQAWLFPDHSRLRVIGPPAPQRVRRAAPPGPKFSAENEQQQLAFPSLPAEVTLPDKFAESQARVAHPVHRLVAAAIDASMILIGIGILLAIFYFAGVSLVIDKASLPYVGAGVFALFSMYRVLWCLGGMDSIGMRWAGLRLINFDGVAPSRSQRACRLISAYFSFLAIGMGMLWAILDEEKLAWHDHISKTFPTPIRKPGNRFCAGMP